MSALLPSAVVIREVGLRDGLQGEAPVPVEGRVKLVEALEGAAEAGVDLERLLGAPSLAAELVAHPVPSRVAAAGPRSRLSTG